MLTKNSPQKTDKNMLNEMIASQLEPVRLGLLSFSQNDLGLLFLLLITHTSPSSCDTDGGKKLPPDGFFCMFHIKPLCSNDPGVGTDTSGPGEAVLLPDDGSSRNYTQKTEI